MEGEYELWLARWTFETAASSALEALGRRLKSWLYLFGQGLLFAQPLDRLVSMR